MNAQSITRKLQDSRTVLKLMSNEYEPEQGFKIKIWITTMTKREIENGLKAIDQDCCPLYVNESNITSNSLVQV